MEKEIRTIQFHKNCDAETKENLVADLARITERFGFVVSSEIQFDITKSVKPNHAAIFNKIQRIGNDCLIMATNGLFSIVQFRDGEIAFYRNEDLSQ